MEARNYGPARHYDPFPVNTVVGFIGPEYLYKRQADIRAGLEDHFMGKLSGISMAATAAIINHADADQNLNENLMISARHCRLQLHHGDAAARRRHHAQLPDYRFPRYRHRPSVAEFTAIAGV